MSLHKIIAVSLTIGITVLLYFLPRTVVNNESEELAGNASDNQASANSAQQTTDSASKSMEGVRSGHGNSSVSKETRSTINDLRKKINNSDNSEEFNTFAKSLAQTYHKAHLYDSAVHFANRLELNKDDKWAIDIYYDAFSFAVNEQKKSGLAKKTRNLIEKISGEKPDNPDIKAKLAMTYVATSTPMKGVTMLKDILKEHPKHTESIFNLGLLSIQSGQFQKGVERFETLTELEPNSYENKFYLGVCYYNTNKQDKAINLFKEIENNADDPLLVSSAQEYLKN